MLWIDHLLPLLRHLPALPAALAHCNDCSAADIAVNSGQGAGHGRLPCGTRRSCTTSQPCPALPLRYDHPDHRVSARLGPSRDAEEVACRPWTLDRTEGRDLIPISSLFTFIGY